jgi:hypothetical protein
VALGLAVLFAWCLFLVAPWLARGFLLRPETVALERLQALPRPARTQALAERSRAFSGASECLWPGSATGLYASDVSEAEVLAFYRELTEASDWVACGACDASGVTARSSDESTTLSVGILDRSEHAVQEWYAFQLGLPLEEIERAARESTTLFSVTISYMHPVFRLLCR